MISAVDKININVRDQDAARRFWIDTMGFSLVTGEPIGEEPSGARWIEVRPPHSAVTLVLYSLTFDASRLGLTVPRYCSPAMTYKNPPGADRPRRGVP
jgi:catechol 2,3-dioxygenase-like lactoylglutathione lyase family enzyme